jgi:hypothetical protein
LRCGALVPSQNLPRLRIGKAVVLEVEGSQFDMTVSDGGHRF